MKPNNKSLEDKIDCPDCLGTGEVVEYDSNGEDFVAFQCTLCMGEGKIAKTDDKYTKSLLEDDFEDDDFNDIDYE